MNRFKARAWHKERKKMYEVEMICPYQDEHTKGGEVFLKSEEKTSFYFPEEVEVQQCTGRYDDKKNLIYEGDIVNGHCGVYWGKMLVVREEKSAAFWFKRLERKGNLLPFISDPMFVEILGNEYENPELLEG